MATVTKQQRDYAIDRAKAVIRNNFASQKQHFMEFPENSEILEKMGFAPEICNSPPTFNLTNCIQYIKNNHPAYEEIRVYNKGITIQHSKVDAKMRKAVQLAIDEIMLGDAVQIKIFLSTL